MRTQVARNHARQDLQRVRTLSAVTQKSTEKARENYTKTAKSTHLVRTKTTPLEMRTQSVKSLTTSDVQRSTHPGTQWSPHLKCVPPLNKPELHNDSTLKTIKLAQKKRGNHSNQLRKKKTTKHKTPSKRGTLSHNVQKSYYHQRKKC